jgi:hypothetical protein
MVASFIVATSVGAMAAVVSYGNVPDGNVPGWCGYDYFVGRVASVEFPDKGAAGKRDCHYGNYDGSY